MCYGNGFYYIILIFYLARTFFWWFMVYKLLTCQEQNLKSMTLIDLKFFPEPKIFKSATVGGNIYSVDILVENSLVSCRWSCN